VTTNLIRTAPRTRLVWSSQRPYRHAAATVETLPLLYLQPWYFGAEIVPWPNRLPADTMNFACGERLMHRLLWIAIPLALAGCGGSKSATTLTVTCTGGVQLVGATSVNVLGDVVNGRPTISYPDPVNPAKTGSIAVEPRGTCKVAPQAPS
jgi:hypothetical protein